MCTSLRGHSREGFVIPHDAGRQDKTYKDFVSRSDSAEILCFESFTKIDSSGGNGRTVVVEEPKPEWTTFLVLFWEVLAENVRRGLSSTYFCIDDHLSLIYGESKKRGHAVEKMKLAKIPFLQEFARDVVGKTSFVSSDTGQIVHLQQPVPDAQTSHKSNVAKCLFMTFSEFMDLGMTANTEASRDLNLYLKNQVIWRVEYRSYELAFNEHKAAKLLKIAADEAVHNSEKLRSADIEIQSLKCKLASTGQEAETAMQVADDNIQESAVLRQQLKRKITVESGDKFRADIPTKDSEKPALCLYTWTRKNDGARFVKPVRRQLGSADENEIFLKKTFPGMARIIQISPHPNPMTNWAKCRAELKKHEIRFVKLDSAGNTVVDDDDRVRPAGGRVFQFYQIESAEMLTDAALLAFMSNENPGRAITDARNKRQKKVGDYFDKTAMTPYTRTFANPRGERFTVPEVVETTTEDD